MPRTNAFIDEVSKDLVARIESGLALALQVLYCARLFSVIDFSA